MTLFEMKRRNHRNIFRSATFFAFSMLMAACTTAAPNDGDWAAHGYLTPGPTSEPEIIGIFKTRAECHAAGENWMSRQVVGNPVFAECLRVDRR